ncbi:MAG TPA: ABC transporter permease [Candidatus Binatia bacterium]|nr:ABC transporter permease [Candidatus Binatia bacterium]
MRRIAAVTWARSLEFLRDRSTLAWNVLAPLLMVGGFALVFAGPGQPLFKVAVLGQIDPAAHPFLATPYVRFFAVEDSATTLKKVAHHQVDLLLDLRTPPGRYWVNPESPKGVTLERMLAGTPGPQPLREAVGGKPVRYVDWVVPGLLGLNLMFSCLFGIGYVIVRYRKSGYLKRLNATPLRPLEFLAAQLLSRLLLVVTITCLCFAGTNAFLHFRMEGSYLDLFAVMLAGAVCMIALGLTVAARVTSEELAGGLLNLLTWPMMVLSGVFYSTDSAPPLVRQAASFLPLTRMLDAARAVMLDGARLADVAAELVPLVVMAAVFLALGSAMFRWSPE